MDTQKRKAKVRPIPSHGQHDSVANVTKELDLTGNEIKVLPVRSGLKELGPDQLKFDLGVHIQTERDGVGMGVLSDGTPFLTGRGLARLVDMENLHIRTIGIDWNDDSAKPRIAAIKNILASRGVTVKAPYVEVHDGVRPIHAFPDVVCLAILEYYAFDAEKPREIARRNYRILAGKALRDFIYSQVGYDPTGKHANKFDKWHERIAQNYQSAPRGFFHVFNEANTIIYELIMAGAEIGERTVVDISIGTVWSKYWEEKGLQTEFGNRERYPHRYPESHPQSKSNPQESWCYPVSALGRYREWLQDVYLGGGKFSAYLKGKVAKGELPPSVAQLALETLVPKQITDSKD